MTDPLDELLDARLREELPYIDDNGFTARVMRQLPRRRFSLQTQRAMIVFVTSIVGVIVAYFASGEGMFVQQALARLAHLPPLQLLFLTLASTMMIMLAGIYAALARAREL
jgi:hypothetical protein